MALWILLGALAFANPTPALSSKRDAAVERLREGVTLFDKGEFAAAEATMIEAIAIDANLIEARLSLARILMQRDRYADARQVLVAAIAREMLPISQVVELGYALGCVHEALGHDTRLATEQRRDELRDATHRFADVIAAEPRHFRAHYGRARALDALDLPEQADRDFRACIAIEPRYAPCWIGLGQMYVDDGLNNLGLAILTTGVEVNPQDAKLWSGLGRAHLTLGDMTRAVTAYETASALDPELVEVFLGLGLAYAELGRPVEAVDRLRAFLARADHGVSERAKADAQDMLARLQELP